MCPAPLIRSILKDRNYVIFLYRSNLIKRKQEMRKKRKSPEQIISLLHQADVLLSSGISISLMCRELGMSDATYYKWRKDYGGMDIDDAKRFKELERENTRLKQVVADLSLDKQILKEAASGNF